ncbi:MAG TPA: glycosyltransferase [Myxococcota bacterium]|nr:glycosyltransferase [Myxococcota bacterium]HRY92645.1 glycosyltransferase [Myxococcota bacterium]HSA22812.1 glycosyltransferase [Myxococcota bacterium]
MRVLGLAIDGRGLGHLSRVRLLARLIRELRPEAEVRLATESPAAWTASGDGLPVLKLPECLHPAGALNHARSRGALLSELLGPLLGGWRPELAVVDHVVDLALFQALRRLGCRVWVVLRRMRPAPMRALLRAPAASLVEAWLLPHAPDELPGMDLPRSFRRRCHHLGPLARPIDLDRVEVLRRASPHPLLLAALGGGGAAEARSLAGVCIEAFERLHRARPDLAARLVCGPLFPGPLPAGGPGLEVLSHEPELAEWMAAADVVITQAGYNSVQELLSSGTPGLLLPIASPGRDDQTARAAEVAALGRARVVAAEPEALASALLAVLAGKGPPRALPRQPDLAPARAALGRLLDQTFPTRSTSP